MAHSLTRDVRALQKHEHDKLEHAISSGYYRETHQSRGVVSLLSDAIVPTAQLICFFLHIHVLLQDKCLWVHLFLSRHV